MRPTFFGCKMEFLDALERVMARDKVNRSDLARACGVGANAMNRRFERRSDLPISTAARMANALGYRIALVPDDLELPDTAAEIAVDDEDRHLRS